MSTNSMTPRQAAVALVAAMPKGVSIQQLEEYGIKAMTEQAQAITQEVLSLNLFWIFAAIDAHIPQKYQSVNDPPALAQADIGIAIGSGTDIAKETGGIVLIKDDLRDVALAVELSKKTMTKINSNLFWAFIYNTVMIPVAAVGLMNPILAAGAMAVSSLTVVTNSAWLKLSAFKFEKLNDKTGK